MTADQYLQNILAREAVNNSTTSSVLAVQIVLRPILNEWAGNQLRSISPSGSFAKGTANNSSTDIDLFISLKSDTTNTLKDIYATLTSKMREKGYSPREQNVSINVRVGSFNVDLVPAKHQGGNSEYHSLYRRRADTWTQTNVTNHIATVRNGGRLVEARILKLWRNKNNLDFPSFYLELATISALRGSRGTLSENVWKAFEYFRTDFAKARIVDPANTNNVISDDLSATAKAAIAKTADRALQASDWNQIVT